MSYKVTIDLEFESKPSTNQIIDYVKELGNDLDYKLQNNSKDKKEISAHDMTDEEVAKSVDLETSDFDDSGDMLDELRDIMDGNV